MLLGSPATGENMQNFMQQGNKARNTLRNSLRNVLSTQRENWAFQTCLNSVYILFHATSDSATYVKKNRVCSCICGSSPVYPAVRSTLSSAIIHYCFRFSQWSQLRTLTSMNFCFDFKAKKTWVVAPALLSRIIDWAVASIFRVSLSVVLPSLLREISSYWTA